MDHPIKVKILDQEYLVKSEEDREQVYRVAEYVNEKLREVKDSSEGLSEKKATILAALNIASEYFQLLKEKDDLAADIQGRTKSLIKNIDTAITEISNVPPSITRVKPIAITPVKDAFRSISTILVSFRKLGASGPIINTSNSTASHGKLCIRNRRNPDSREILTLFFTSNTEFPYYPSLYI